MPQMSPGHRAHELVYDRGHYSKQQYFAFWRKQQWFITPVGGLQADAISVIAVIFDRELIIDRGNDNRAILSRKAAIDYQDVPGMDSGSEH